MVVRGRIRCVTIVSLVTLPLACGTSESRGQRQGDGETTGGNAGVSGSGTGERSGAGGTNSSSGNSSGGSLGGAPTGGAPTAGASVAGASGSSGASSGGSNAAGADTAGGAGGTGGLGGSGGGGPCIRRGGRISEVPSCEALAPIVLQDLRVRTSPDGFVNAGWTGAIDVWVIETAGYDSVESILHFDFGGIEVGFSFPDTDGDVGLFPAACSNTTFGVRVFFPSDLASGTVIPITAHVRTADADCENTSRLAISVTVR